MSIKLHEVDKTLIPDLMLELSIEMRNTYCRTSVSKEEFMKVAERLEGGLLKKIKEFYTFLGDVSIDMDLGELYDMYAVRYI